MGNELNKGATAEEMLRSYFQDLGYFVVRSAKVQVDGFDVTDIDLWLYNRPTPLTRERINVDIKNKKTPQALERVFWAKGVQKVLGFDHCIVATTDRRKEVVRFGKDHGVTVLDGGFLGKLKEKATTPRMSDESFRDLSATARQSRAQTSWYDKGQACASALVLKLGYDGCNSLVPEIRFFLEQALANNLRRGEALRYSYLLTSYFLVSLDFALSETAFLSSEERQAVIDEGLRFGSSGRAATEQTIELATKLAVAAVPSAATSHIRQTLQVVSEGYHVQILAEFFARNLVSSSLFGTARELNRLAFERDLQIPAQLTNGVRATLFVFLDFFGIERKTFAELSGGPPQTELFREEPK